MTDEINIQNHTANATSDLGNNNKDSQKHFELFAAATKESRIENRRKRIEEKKSSLLEKP